MYAALVTTILVVLILLLPLAVGVALWIAHHG